MYKSDLPGIEGTIARTLGMLYEKKARGITLIRVLEDYRRFQATQKRGPRNARCGAYHAPATPQQELARLRLRRAAVDQVIRSIEAYSSAQTAAPSHH